MTGPWDGLLLLDKHGGPTSHDMVDAVRRITGEQRVGHAGTLDPSAAGLLPLVLGRATRLVRFLPASPKTYCGRLQLGIRTRTDDLMGEVVARHPGPLPEPAAVLIAAQAMLGTSLQTPPAVSARKVAGQRLYRLARRGAQVSAPPTEVVLTRWDLEPGTTPGEFAFTAVVSSGTYIRALVRDLGDTLGCGGALSALVRTQIGPMHLDQALRLDPTVDPAIAPPALESILRERLISLERMPLDLPSVTLDSSIHERRFLAGSAVGLVLAAPLPGPCRVLAPDGRLLGVGDTRNGLLHPKVVLEPAPCLPPAGPL